MNIDDPEKSDEIDTIEVASERGNNEVVERLLVDGVTPSGTFALPLAIQHNQKEVVQTLLSMTQVWDNMTLHISFCYAVEYGNESVVDFVLSQHQNSSGFCMSQEDIDEAIEVATEKKYWNILRKIELFQRRMTG